MKKIYLVIVGAVCVLLMAASCCNCCNNYEKKCCFKDCKGPKMECNSDRSCPAMPCPNLTEEQRKALDEIVEKWEKFDELSESEQKELIMMRKAFVDQREAEIKAKKEAFEAAWANFDNLSIKEQKALLEAKCCCPKRGCPQQGPRHCDKPGYRPEAPRGSTCPNK